MISNFVLTPNVFEDRNSKQNIISVMKDSIANPIFVVEYQGANWSKTILVEYISKFEQKYRDRFQVLLKNIKDQKKLIKQTNHNLPLNTSDDWMKVSEKALNSNLIDFVITDDELKDSYKSTLNENCESINDIIEEDTKWDVIKNKRSLTLTKTKSNLSPFFNSFMPYSSKLVIIDPYFEYITKYQNFLRLCSEIMGNRVNFPRNSCKIEIHTRYVNGNNYNFQTFLTSLKSQFDHSYTVYIWDDSKVDAHKFHDRFIMTESIGFSVSHSFDISDSSNQETTWSFLDRQTQSKHMNNYREEDPLFKLNNKIEV